MDELLQRVAEIRGMPASLIQRSAEARAEKEGISVEAVLTDWAGETPAEPDQTTPDTEPTTSQEPPPETASPSASATATESAATDAPAEITVDRLVQLAADAKRMPPKLILSSATARAEHGNTTLEAVLMEWAGVSIDDLSNVAQAPATEDSEQATVEEPEPDVDPEPETAPGTVAAVAVAGAMTMDALLERVAEVKGMPAVLAKRSAEARAKKTGESVEEVLAEWAEVDASVVAAEPAEETVDSPQAAETEEPEIEPEQAEAPSDEPEIIEAEAPDLDVPVADETPLVRGGYPRWLAAAFILIPLLAVTYILVAPNGPDCGTAGQLFVDPETGVALNCDGSEYGTNEVDFLAVGAGVYNQCVACHAADGSGGAGPAFTGGAVLATFPAGSCSDHIEWVGLGTAGWPEPTYGATDKPVGGSGLMPAFSTTLSEEQLASVVLYERVEFGGQPLEEAQDDCGLVEEVVEDEATVEASAP